MNMNITTKVAATSSLRSNPVRLYACSEAQLDINISISAVSHGGGGGYSEKPQTQHPDQSVPIHEEERKHGWDSLSDDRKKQIEVGDAGYSSLCIRPHVLPTDRRWPSCRYCRHRRWLLRLQRAQEERRRGTPFVISNRQPFIKPLGKPYRKSRTSGLSRTGCTTPSSARANTMRAGRAAQSPGSWSTARTSPPTLPFPAERSTAPPTTFAAASTR